MTAWSTSILPKLQMADCAAGVVAWPALSIGGSQSEVNFALDFCGAGVSPAVSGGNAAQNRRRDAGATDAIAPVVALHTTSWSALSRCDSTRLIESRLSL